MFGREKTSDNDLRASHREYYRNCLIQLADLEARTADWKTLKTEFAAVWSDDATADEITQKIALGRKLATNLQNDLATTTIEAAAKALELLQEIIDNVEHQLQGLLAGLVTAQAMRSASQ